MASDATGHPRVLRISHSAVVAGWRQRERLLRHDGVELTLVTAKAWEEGGTLVRCVPGADDFTMPVATVGRHPNLFVFDPCALWHFLTSGPWDLIDMHEEPFGTAVAEVLLLRWLSRARVPFVLTSAQNIEKRYPVPFRWFERWSLRRAAGAYTCNVEAGRILRARGLTGPAIVLPLGVDVERFRPAHRTTPRGRLRVAFVGRLIPHKGVGVLLDAAGLDDRLDVEIFGAGPEGAALVARARRLGIADRVAFHGFVDDGHLPGTYRKVDVLAVPSVPQPGWTEQFGRVVVEAQASGVPVVATATGALPEVVGDAGILVPPSDPRALAEGLSRYLEEDGLWAAHRAAGLDRATRSSWARVAAAQRAFYDDVIDGTSGSAPSTTSR